jgi:hypothetical protein
VPPRCCTGSIAGSPGTRLPRSRRWRGTTVLLDDLDAGVGRSLFGALRDELWRLEVTWVVGAAAAEVDALLRPPVDAFFEVVTVLEPLPPDEAAELIRRRGTEISAEDRTALARLAEGAPRRLVDLARAVAVDGASIDDLAAHQDVRSTRLGQVSRPAADLAVALESLGAAGPSDAALQARMGVSRPRLVTLFRELRDAGLVHEVGPARDAGGPGRPRVRFVLSGTVGGPREAASDVS